MIPQLGQISLVFALVAALLQCAWPVLRRSTGRAPGMAVVRSAACVYFIGISIAFAALITAYVESDFSLANVAANSHTDKPLFYKVTGVWGNHEGSMLLWLWVLGLYSFILALSDFRR